MADGDFGPTEGQTEAHQWLANFWDKTTNEVKATKSVSTLNKTIMNLMMIPNSHCLTALLQDDFKNQELPLARIKKIMKLDEDVKMISQEAPLLFAKAAEIFISELALRSWVQTEDSKRRTLQVNVMGMLIPYYEKCLYGLYGCY